MEPDVRNQDTEAYVTNLSYYHLVPFETDILEWLSLAAKHPIVLTEPACLMHQEP